jgi:hypothetical protein
LGTFTGKFREVVEHVYQAALNLFDAIRAPFLIKQYEKVFKRVKQLLKHTRHSKRGQQREKYLKWLHKQLAGLKKTYDS